MLLKPSGEINQLGNLTSQEIQTGDELYLLVTPSIDVAFSAENPEEGGTPEIIRFANEVLGIFPTLLAFYDGRTPYNRSPVQELGLIFDGSTHLLINVDAESYRNGIVIPKGFVCGELSDNIFNLYAIAITKGLHNKGIGGKLFAEIINQTNALAVTGQTNNPFALRLRAKYCDKNPGWNTVWGRDSLIQKTKRNRNRLLSRAIKQVDPYDGLGPYPAPIFIGGINPNDIQYFPGPFQQQAMKMLAIQKPGLPYYAGVVTYRYKK